MNIEKIAGSLNSYLSIYGVRFLVVFFTIFFIVALFIIKKFFSKSSSLKTISLIVIFLVILTLGGLPFVYYKVPLEKSNVISVLLTLLPLLFLFIAFLLNRLSVKSSLKGKKVFYVSSFVSLSLTICALLFVLFISLFARPYVSLAGLQEDTVIEENSSFKMRLTVPVMKESLNIVISPEQEIEVIYDYVANSSHWIEGFEVVPTENYPADSKIVVYVVGLSNMIPGSKVHEQSLEFLAPSLPTIKSTNFDNITQDVNVESDLEIQLDRLNVNSAKWSFEIEPPVEYEVLINGDKIKVDFKKLSQGTSYSIKIFRANRIYNAKTKEEVSVQNQTLIKELSFKTINPPGIKSFNWHNVSLANSTPLIVEFTDSVSPNTFTNLYRIEPSIPHTISVGSNGSSFILSPKGGFTKDTQYTLTFLKGLKTQSGGFFEQDVPVSFRTAGVVRAIAFSPRNGMYGVKRDTKRVSVVFDQPVDKASAESRFRLEPNIPGTFSWSGNTLIYTLSNSLDFYTKYTVSISPGVVSVYGINSNQTFSSSFTSEEQVVILNVPQYYQPRGFDCNLYSAKMALAYRGVSISVDAAKTSIGIGEDPNSSWVNEYGTHWGPLSSFVGSFRPVSVRGGWNAIGLAEEIMKGNPSIVYVYNGASTPIGPFELPGGFTGYKGMHSEVVVGFTGRPDNPTSILTNDPWRGRRKYTLGSFYNIWGYLGNRAIIVF
ncbi:MAG TPA: Ig-like domain-containing protein [Candidatus Dojkabacteria bacterium]|nr:Ig-like domain-containing protein [Candidatus Dojkabacteria bacterium]